jgi:hypothetical protein
MLHVGVSVLAHRGPGLVMCDEGGGGTSCCHRGTKVPSSRMSGSRGGRPAPKKTKGFTLGSGESRCRFRGLYDIFQSVEIQSAPAGDVVIERN